MSAADIYVRGEFEIEVPSGKCLDFIDPQPGSIVLEDIAHSLAQISRFGGHASRRYSVAEHAVRVSWKLMDMGCNDVLQMAGLHHDDAEAYLGDIPSPLKGLFGYSYRSLTRSIDQVIFVALARSKRNTFAPHPPNLWEVDMFQSPEVKAADMWALSCEAHEFMPSKGEGWTTGEIDEMARTYGWPEVVARDRWLAVHTILKRKILGC